MHLKDYTAPEAADNPSALNTSDITTSSKLRITTVPPIGTPHASVILPKRRVSSQETVLLSQRQAIPGANTSARFVSSIRCGDHSTEAILLMHGSLPSDMTTARYIQCGNFHLPTCYDLHVGLRSRLASMP